MGDTVELHGVYVTRLAGPARDDGGSRIMIEILAAAEDGTGPYPLRMDPDQATEVGLALIRAAGRFP